LFIELEVEMGGVVTEYVGEEFGEAGEVIAHGLWFIPAKIWMGMN